MFNWFYKGKSIEIQQSIKEEKIILEDFNQLLQEAGLGNTQERLKGVLKQMEVVQLEDDKKFLVELKKEIDNAFANGKTKGILKKVKVKDFKYLHMNTIKCLHLNGINLCQHNDEFYGNWDKDIRRYIDHKPAKYMWYSFDVYEVKK